MIDILNKDFPDILLRPQLMVGFPSETEQEFQDTVKLLDRLHFDFVEVYMFQRRPGTKAAEFPGQIAHGIIRWRTFRLLLKLLFKTNKRKNEKPLLK